MGDAVVSVEELDTTSATLLRGTVTSLATSASRNVSSINASMLRALIYQHFMQIINDKQYNYATQAMLIASFATLIVFGVVGNGLVCTAVIRNRQMRTPRNLFIVNLAVSDMTLCLLSQPLNLVQLLYFPLWNLGDVMCRLVSMLPATNVFVSAMSITAIALDRLQLTTCPTNDIAKKVGPAATLGSIWLVSLIMASPVLLISGTKDISALGVVVYTACMEKPEMSDFRFAYSVSTLVCQYALPTSVVIAAYVHISCTIRARSVRQRQRRLTSLASLRLSVRSSSHRSGGGTRRSTMTTVTSSDAGGARGSIVATYEAVSTADDGGVQAAEAARTTRHCRRAHKTVVLLLAIVAVFAVSWLPLNAYNLLVDFNQAWVTTADPRRLLVPMCHLCVLLSACVNPVLYGWLNDNFHREFFAILRICLPCLRCLHRGGGRGGGRDWVSSAGYSLNSRVAGIQRLTKERGEGGGRGVVDTSALYPDCGPTYDTSVSPPTISASSCRHPLLVTFNDLAPEGALLHTDQLKPIVEVSEEH